MDYSSLGQPNQGKQTPHSRIVLSFLRDIHLFLPLLNILMDHLIMQFLTKHRLVSLTNRYVMSQERRIVEGIAFGGSRFLMHFADMGCQFAV